MIQTGLQLYIAAEADTTQYRDVENPLPACDDPLAVQLLVLREAVAAAVSETNTAALAAAQPLNDALALIEDILSDTNRMLRGNPQQDVVSLDDLTTQMGRLPLNPSDDSIAARLAERHGVTVAGGVMFPRGTTSLLPYARLRAAIGCSLDEMQRRMEAAQQSFILVTTQEETIAVETENACGSPVVQYEISERVIAVDRSLAESATMAGIAEEAVQIRMFWVDQLRGTYANTARLRAMGIVGTDLAAVLGNRTEGRVETMTVLRSVLPELRRSGASETDLCALLARTGAASPRINTSPTIGDISDAIESALRAGAGGDNAAAPLLMQAADLPKSMRFDLPPVDRDALPKGCGMLYDALQSAVNGVTAAMSIIRSLLSKRILNLSIGSALTSDALGLTNCLLRFNLGIGLGFSLSLGFPAKFRLLNLAIKAALSVVLALLTAFSKVLCIVDALVQAVYGGICGLAPLDTGLCPAPLEIIVEKARTLTNLARSITLDLSSLLGDSQLSFASTGNFSADLNISSVCQSTIAAFAVLAFAAIRAAATEQGRNSFAASVAGGAEQLVDKTKNNVVGQASNIKRNLTTL